MKLPHLFLAALLAFSAQGARADDATREEAGKLLDKMGMQENLTASMQTMLELQLQQNPKLVPYRGVMERFFAKYMSYESLREDMVAIYAAEFTVDELREARAFYSTPTGQKFVATMPTMMQQGAELGARRVQEHLPELVEMVEEEAARIEAVKAKDESGAPEPAQP